MKSIILLCAVGLSIAEKYGTGNTEGVGAFAYDGPSGRYGGTYGLKDGQVVDKQGTFPPDFQPPTFQDFDDFFPEYFNNLENLLQEILFPQPSFYRQPFYAFRRPKPFFRRTFDNVENQKLAYGAATKAFDLTTNRAGSNQFVAPSRSNPFGGNFPGFDGFQGGPGFPGFQSFQGFNMPNSQGNGDRAFAGAAVGPGYTHQVADINPPNPNNPNINKFSNTGGSPGGFRTVSSSASFHTRNVNGKTISDKRAETVVNDNGVITRYKVQS